MGKTPRTVIIDICALTAKATGEITHRANECLEGEGGELRVATHPIITYEFMLQFHRGRIPIFETPEEALRVPRDVFYTQSYEILNNRWMVK
ncbi:MAG: hypothetical protein QXF21_03835 [Thermoproteota archaeon]